MVVKQFPPQPLNIEDVAIVLLEEGERGGGEAFQLGGDEAEGCD